MLDLRRSQQCCWAFKSSVVTPCQLVYSYQYSESTMILWYTGSNYWWVNSKQHPIISESSIQILFWCMWTQFNWNQGPQFLSKILLQVQNYWTKNIINKPLSNQWLPNFSSLHKTCGIISNDINTLSTNVVCYYTLHLQKCSFTQNAHFPFALCASPLSFITPTH